MEEWSQFAVNAVVAGFRYAGLATGFYLLRQANGFLDMSFVAAYTLAAYCSVAVFSARLPSLFLALAASVVSLEVLRRLIRRSPRRPGLDDSQTLAGFGVAITAVGIALMAAGPGQYAGEALREIPQWAVPGGGILVGTQLLILCFGFFAVLATLAAYHAPWAMGHYLRAHGEAPALAFSLGLPVERIENLALVLAGTIIGGGAAVSTWDLGVEPEFGLRVGLQTLLAVYIVGGRRPLAAALGGAVLGGTQELVSVRLEATWKEGATLFLLLVAGTAFALRELWRRRRLLGASL